MIQFDAGNNYICKHGLLLEALHGIGQFLDQIQKFQLGSPRLGYDIIIRTDKKAFIPPVKLPDQPFATISRNGVSCLAAHGYTYSCQGSARVATYNNEML